MNSPRGFLANLVLAASVFFACEPDPGDVVEEQADSVVQAPSGGDDCTLTQGYWKNHEEAWPVASLSIGGVTYGKAELLTLFRTPPRGDASLILGHQLIAALLNGASGASAPSGVASALSAADAWMAAHSDRDGRLPYGVRGGAAGQEAIALSETLASYNEGGIGPGHCGDGASGGTGGGAAGTGGGAAGTGGGVSGEGGGTSAECARSCVDNECQTDFACIDGCCTLIIN